MASPTLILEEYQFEDAGIGVLLNGSTSLPFCDISSVQGLDNAPFRVQQHDMEGQDGGYVDSEFETVRTVTIEGTAYANPTSMETYLDSLKANYAPHKLPKPFYFMTDAGQRVVFGKSQGFRYSKDEMRRRGTANFQIQIICEDPRIYTDTLITNSATRATGSVSVTVGGNRPTPAKITLTGSITSPTVTYTRTGAVMAFTGYTLGAGQQIVIDLINRTVVQAGVSKRNAMTLTGTWFMLEPGVNTFNYGGTGSTATIAVETRSAWR
jgi:phage-related protein